MFVWSTKIEAWKSQKFDDITMLWNNVCNVYEMCMEQLIVWNPDRARIKERDYEWNYKLTVDYSFAVHVCIRFRQIPRISGRSYRFTEEWCHYKADLSPACSSGSSMWRCDGINLRYDTVVWTIPQFGFPCRTQKSLSLVIYILCSLIGIVALQRL